MGTKLHECNRNSQSVGSRFQAVRHADEVRRERRHLLFQVSRTLIFATSDGQVHAEL